jgi:putative flippase GtrA
MILRGRKLGELIRFGITGAACVALNIAIVALLVEFAHLHYLLSLTICFVTVTAVGFALNRYWTFRRRGGKPMEDYRRYATVAVINLLVSLGLCAFCVDVLKIRYPIAMVILSIVFVPLTFVLHRTWTFGMQWRERELP